MRFEELQSKLPKGVKVFVDMDGVLADLFNYAAELQDVEHYNHMSKEQWERFLQDTDAYHLFRSIPPFPTANKLLQIVIDFVGSYTILSSPLSYDKEGSIKGKREWLSKNIHVPASSVIFEHDKYKYAVNSDGTPNILIDDFKENTDKWTSAGGIAIKYQADEDSLQTVIDGLKSVADKNIDEGWKDWVAGAALGATALGANAVPEKPFNGPGPHVSKPAHVQNIKAPAQKKVKPLVVQKQTQPAVQTKKIEPPRVSQKELDKTVTGNPHEVLLTKVAKKEGIAGQELAAFLSQCAHETLDFQHMKEIGGKLDFKKYDPRYAPKKAKQLGNIRPGDGEKYKGRGYIQLTGRANYKKASEALGLPLEDHPELVERPDIAAKVAVWYWKDRVQSSVKNFKDTHGVTKGINPGMRGLDKRIEKLKAFQVAVNK